MTGSQLINRFWNAFRDGDIETYEACLHSGFVATYPQSGEVIRGRDNFMATIRNRPDGLPGPAELHLKSNERLASVPSSMVFGYSNITVIGGDSLHVGEAELTYPDGTVYNTCSIFRMRDNLIASETAYFAEPFDAPEWRSQWVEST